MANDMKAWFVRFRGEATEPFYPFAVNCYVGGPDEDHARQVAITCAAATSGFSEAFDDPLAVAGERLIDIARCPDMDDAISPDPEANRQAARLKGLWGLRIAIDAGGPRLEWVACAGIAEARALERAFIEHLFETIPGRVFITALEDPGAKT